jgi:hypothetical protein
MKTLLDALRSPQNEHEIGENTPRNMGPIYTLLDDDHLVTKLSVNTSHLLAPELFGTPPQSEDGEEKVFMLIDVNVRLEEGNLENLPFMV